MGWSRRAARGAAIAVLTLLCAASSAHATFPGKNGRLAFDMPNGAVHTIEPDGSGETVKFTDSRYHGHLSYGWAGTQLAWTGRSGDTTTGFVTGSGSSVSALANTGPDADYMALSPDGKWVAFSSQRPGTDREIFASRIDGTDSVRLVPDPAPGAPRWDVAPEWAPDGTKLVYMRLEPSGYKLRLFDLETRANTELATTAKAVSPSFSPDGTKIAYLDAAGGDTWGQVYVKTLGSPGIGTPVPGAYGIEPTFSPDGTKLAFIEQKEGRHVVTVNLDGSGRTYLRNAPWQFDRLNDLVWAQDCRPGPLTPADGSEVLTPGKTIGGLIDGVAGVLAGLGRFPFVDLPVGETLAGLTKGVDATLPKEVQAELPAELRTLQNAIGRQLDSGIALPLDATQTLKELSAAVRELDAALDGVRGGDAPPCPPRPAEPHVRPDPKSLPLILVKGYQGDQMHGLSDREASSRTGAPCAMFNPLYRRFKNTHHYAGPIIATNYMRGDSGDDGSEPDDDHEGPSLPGCADISRWGRHGVDNSANHAEHWGKSWDCETQDQARLRTLEEHAANAWVTLQNTIQFWKDPAPLPYPPMPCPAPSSAINTWPSPGVANQEDGPSYKMDHCRRWSQSMCVPGGRQPDWTHYAKDYPGDRHTDNTPNQHVAYHLAWYVYENYSRHGRAVNMLAHSQGGTQLRYMLQEVALQRAQSPLAQGNFPPYLLINEIVTVDSTLRGAAPVMNAGCDGLAAVPSLFTFINKGSDFQCLQQMGDSYFQQQGMSTRVNATGGATPQTANDAFFKTQWAALGAGDDVVAPRSSSLPSWVDFHIGYCGSQTGGNRKLANQVLGGANVAMGAGLSGDFAANTEPAETFMGTQFEGTEDNNAAGGPPAGERAGHFYYLFDYGDRPFKLNRFTYTNHLRGANSARQAGPASERSYSCTSAKSGKQPLDVAFEAIANRDR